MGPTRPDRCTRSKSIWQTRSALLERVHRSGRVGPILRRVGVECTPPGSSSRPTQIYCEHGLQEVPPLDHRVARRFSANWASMRLRRDFHVRRADNNEYGNKNAAAAEEVRTAGTRFARRVPDQPRAIAETSAS